MIQIDGSYLSGGGQILRTALALSLLTKKPFTIKNIRKARNNPGLRPQHLECVKIAQQISNAEVEGAEINSTNITFIPKDIKKTNVASDIGTAGSITLLLQSILLPLILHNKKSILKIKGGTNVSMSMPVEYLDNVVLPYFRKYCEKIELNTIKRGYYPKGGGEVHIKITPKYDINTIKTTKKLDLTKQGTLMQIKGTSHTSKELETAQVAERQARSAELALNKLNIPINISSEYVDSYSIGSGITLWAVFNEEEQNIIGADCLGERNKTSEKVGEEAAKKLISEIESKACVDEHLADNLIPLLALVGGRIKTSNITEHIRTNIYTTEQFLDVKFEINEEEKSILVKEQS